MSAPTISDTPGDTVLRDVPADYSLGGTGRWLTLPGGPDEGRKLFFVERRLGDAGDDAPVVLLVHGNPESSYTYRRVVARLAELPELAGGARVVVPDHIGFGRSDQARFEMVDMHHAENLRAFVEALDLRDITLVVHDWGGPIGIGALLLWAPERVRNLVALNTTVFPMPPDGLTYTNFPVPLVFPWARSAKVVPDRLWGTHAAFAVGIARMSYPRLMASYARYIAGHRARRLPHPDADELWVFRDQFASRANARSSKRMVRQTPVWGHGYTYEDPTRGPQDNRPFYRDIQERITPTWGPDGAAIGAAGVFGDWDPCGKPSVVAQWREALPQIDDDLRVFAGEGHFIEEHRPAEIAESIGRLVASGTRDAAT